MLDFYATRHVTERVSESVTVHEHRAPTDESVRLLAEMEKAARDKVVQAIRLENCPIDCVVHTSRDHMSGDSQFCAFIKINGQRIEVRKSFSMTTEPKDMVDGLLQAVAERIAAVLLGPAFNKLAPHLRGVI
jgi:hypothetical protein